MLAVRFDTSISLSETASSLGRDGPRWAAPRTKPGERISRTGLPPSVSGMQSDQSATDE
jgi:hypothetical protein